MSGAVRIEVSTDPPLRSGDLVVVREPEDIQKLILWNDSFTEYTGFLDPDRDVGVIVFFRNGVFSGSVYAFVLGPNGMGLVTTRELRAV